MTRLFLPLVLLATGALFAAPATVQVREASVYAKPTPISKFLGTLPLGTTLIVVTEKGGWAQVKATGLAGWLRTQAFSTKALDVKATDNTSSGVSATEVSLAGRGFTEAIESDYRSKNPNLDFATLDRMESQGIPDDELSQFLDDGGVKPREER
jgi:uncharacterized protein YraI